MNPYASQQGASNLGLGGAQRSGSPYSGANPYLQQNIDSAMGDISRNYNNTVAPARATAQASNGSFGNSGQAAMQLEDQRNLGRTMADTSARMRGQDYTQQQGMYQQDQQNSLARRSLNQNYDLGLRNSDLGFSTLDASINQNNFNNQLSGANFGLDVQNQLQGNDNAAIAGGTQMQNTPLNYYSQFANQANSIGQGYGTTNGSTSFNSQGSPLTGALGGMQLYDAWSKSNPSSTGSGDWATGSGNYSQYTQPDYGAYF